MTFINTLLNYFLENPSICTDTRKIKKDCIFFALKGENFNGNAFAKEALEKGAKFAVIDEVAYASDDNKQVFLVDNALETLQKLATAYRQHLQVPVIAVCGSNGKTTTKELIYRILSQKFKTFATIGNLNNHIGVPLSLLAIPKDAEIAVIEMGANHAGETRELCQIAQPNFGLVTNIGLDHLEGFGSIEGVAEANGEMYEYLFKNNGKIFLNTLEPYLSEMTVHFPKENTYTYPQKNDFLQAEILPSDFYVRVKTHTGEITTQMIGNYNFANIATALCVGKYFDIADVFTFEAIAGYQPSNNRSQLVRKGTNTIFLDAYNANPSSMKLAIENFAQMPYSPKIAIIGDMFELGNHTQQEHENIGQLLAHQNFHTVILFGNEVKYALKYLPEAYYFSDKFSLHNWLSDKDFQNSYFLIKGSRGVSLETALAFLSE